MAGPFRRAGRLHPQRGTADGWGTAPVVPWSPEGFWVDDDIDPASRLDYHLGTVYPQDAASQLPVQLLDPQPGECVIDCCAAPAPRPPMSDCALAVWELLSPPMRVVAASPRAAREPRATGHCHRFGDAGISCRSGAFFPGTADAAVVDAPCSGHEPRSHKQGFALGNGNWSLQASGTVSATWRSYGV